MSQSAMAPYGTRRSERDPNRVSLLGRLLSRIDVMAAPYQAAGDGVADDRAALQAAIDAASAAGGAEVFLPAGVYRVALAGGQKLVPKTGVRLRGDGMGRSVILLDDSAGSAGDGISNNTGGSSYAALAEWEMSDLTLRGLAATLPSGGAQLLRIQVGTLTVERCSFEHSRNMGMVATGCGTVLVRGCRVFRTVADGIAVWNSQSVTITGNQLLHCNDDAISAHSDNDFGEPVRSGIVISHNQITESQGIAVNGPKLVLIQGNTLRRIMASGIRVRVPDSSTQGRTTAYAVRIADNLIADVFQRQEPSPRNATRIGIWLEGGKRKAGTAAAPPGEPAVGTGTVEPLFGTGVGVFHLNDLADAANASPGGRWCTVENNTIVRTLPEVAAVADWGHAASATGLWVGDNGDGSGFYAGAIPEAAFNIQAGIRLDPALWVARVHGNMVECGAEYGILFGSTVAVDHMDFAGLDIAGNVLRDFTVCGIYTPATATSHRVRIFGNELDGDPRFRSVARVAGGKWNSGSPPVGISLHQASGFVVEANRFRNVATAVFQGGGAVNVLRENVAYCQPYAVGGHNDNAGIRVVPAGGAEWTHVIEDSDPASATYGRIIASPVKNGSAMPATGTYVAGHVVWNSAPAVAAGKVLIGWARLTTGSAHVAGTDWSPLYATVS